MPIQRELCGKTILEAQEYLDENYPGHRIYHFSIMGSNFKEYRIRGPEYNRNLKERK